MWQAMSRKPGRKRAVGEAYRLSDTLTRLVGVLDSGLTVILQRFDAAPVAAVRLYVRAGSALEGRWAGSGITHLLEHVVTGGDTKARTAVAIMAFGDSIGGLNNAYTSVDHMCYHATVESGRLRPALDLIADWVVSPTLSEQVFDRELGVVRREWESDRDDASTQLEEMINDIVYRQHPLAYPVIGRADAFARLTYGDLLEYHRTTHTPSNCVLVVAGKLDPDAGLREAIRAFEGFEGPTAPPTALSDPPPIRSPLKAVRVMGVESASLAMAWPTLREGSTDDAPLDLLSSVMTEGDGGRLVKSLRWDRGLVFDLSGGHESFWHSPGTWRVSAQLDSKRLDEVERAIVTELTGKRGLSISEAELDRAKRQNVVGVLSARQTADGLASQIGMDYLAFGTADYSDQYLAAIEATTRDDLERVATKYLTPSGYAMATVLPRRRARHRSGALSANAAPTTGRFELKNGLRCVWRQMAGSGFAAMSASFPGGLRAEDESTNGIFNLLAEVLPRGTAQHSADEMIAAFEQKGSYLRSGSGLDTIGLEFVALPQDAEALLELTAETILSPALATEQLDRVRPSILDAIHRIDDEWSSQLARLARRCFFDRSPYRLMTIGTAENISRFTSEDLRRVHSSHFNGGGIVSIAGDVSPEKVEEVVSRCFGGLPSLRQDAAGTPHRQDADAIPADIGATSKSDRLFVKHAVEDRHVAAMFVGFPGCSVIDRQARAPLAILGTALAGYALSGGRLFAALRGGDRDMAYEVSGAHLSGMLPGYFGVVVAFEPDRIVEVYEVVRREIGELVSGCLGEEELDRARAMILTAELEQLQTPQDYARRDAFDELSGMGVGDGVAYLEEVCTAKREAVCETALRFLTHATVVVVTPQPEAVQIGVEATPIDF